ncbi:MAG TPA: SOS response-associated peptidase family protein [Sphingomonas sp.]|jgi:putative SOS response-associated peptidase YedK|uniref:SOS response-associated peptidase n=1 Tax=Sphingomonas sp. TaxID=28214 RepID=UPI002EDA7886
MCNRYRVTEAEAALMQRYGAQPIYPPDETYPPPELFPKRTPPVIRVEGDARGLDLMSWGFPTMIKGATGIVREKPVTNVRNLTSPFWRSALKDPARRCLVPFTAFSEYGPGPTGAKPLYWFDVPSRPIASFAGIWRPLSDGKRAYAFLTCEPNSLVAPIHPKAMPVILHEEDEQRWLDGELGDLVAPFPSQLMKVERFDPKPKGTPKEEFTAGGDAMGGEPQPTA